MLREASMEIKRCKEKYVEEKKVQDFVGFSINFQQNQLRSFYYTSEDRRS